MSGIRAGQASVHYDNRRDCVLAAQVEDRALRQYLSDLPSPEEAARYLPLQAVEALLTAIPARGTLLARSEAEAIILRPWGMCDCGTNKRDLTAFGMKVRRVLMEQDA